MTANTNQFKAALTKFASGVTVVTTHYDDTDIGITVSAFSSLSIDPLLVMISINKSTYTHEAISESGIFAVNILAADQAEVGMRFAGMIPGLEADRFAGLDTFTAETGSPLLYDVMAWIDCEVWNIYDGGDHSIFVGSVVDIGVNDKVEPLLYGNRTWATLEPLLLEA